MEPSKEDQLLNSENLRIKAKKAVSEGNLAEGIELYGRALHIRTTALGGMERLYPECADLYFEYGQALLDMSRKQSDILGGNIDSEPIPAPSSSAATSIPAFPGLPVPSTVGESSSDAVPSTTAEAITTKIMNVVQQASIAKDDDEEDDLKLAWEMLEAARIMYSKTANCAERLSDVLLTLGEVAMEDDQFDSAVKDLNECTTIRRRIFNRNDRRLAEAYFTHGIALQLAMKHKEAHKSFIEAAAVIESCLETETDEKTVSDLKLILEDITAKAEDTGEELPIEIKPTPFTRPTTTTTGFTRPTTTTQTHVLEVKRPAKSGDIDPVEVKRAKTL